MLKKGFLGPIGDDLPSLIPLVFALMMFFYVFTFTWNAFDERGQAFNDALTTLRVGKTIKGNNYLRGYQTFEQRCKEAQSVKRVKFLAGLLELATGPKQKFEPIDIEGLEGKFFQDQEKFTCTNTEGETPGYESQDLIIRSFPVALEFQDEEEGAFYIRPMLLVVVTWR